MTTQIRLSAADALPSAELEDWGEVKVPLGTPIARLRGRLLCENPDGSSAGLWECSPGRWVRQVMDAELSTFLAGYAVFEPEDGEPFAIRAGDVVYFPPMSRGVWDVRETLRKTYLVYRGAPDTP